MIITHIKDYFCVERNTEFLTEDKREKKMKNKKRKGIHKYTHIQTAEI